MRRGVPTVLLIRANDPVGKLTSVCIGFPKLGWFQMLKKSAVKRSDCLSVRRRFLISEKSQFCWNGPR